MGKTYTFTEEEILSKCIQAFLISTLSMLVMGHRGKDDKKADLDDTIDEIVALFTK